MPSATTPLVNEKGISSPPQEKVAFPLGFFSPKVRPYLELIRLHKVSSHTLLLFSDALSCPPSLTCNYIN